MDSHRWRAAGDFTGRRDKEVDTVKVCDCRARELTCSGDTVAMVFTGMFWIAVVAGFAWFLRRWCRRGGFHR